MVFIAKKNAPGYCWGHFFCILLMPLNIKKGLTMSNQQSGSIRCLSKNRYTTVPNHILKNPTITASAKALYCYLWSKPESYYFTTKNVAKEFKECEDTIKKIFRELIKTGYIKRDRMLDKGRFSHFIYTLFDTPEENFFSATIVGISAAEKTNDIIRTDVIKKKSSKKETPVKNYFDSVIDDFFDDDILGAIKQQHTQDYISYYHDKVKRIYDTGKIKTSFVGYLYTSLQKDIDNFYTAIAPQLQREKELRAVEKARKAEIAKQRAEEEEKTKLQAETMQRQQQAAEKRYTSLTDTETENLKKSVIAKNPFLKNLSSESLILRELCILELML